MEKAEQDKGAKGKKNVERMRIPRQKVPEQEPQVRVHNFEEVPFGYTSELAVLEATRCLQCKKAPCIAGCPVEIDIPAFLKLLEEGDFLGAAAKIKEANLLPAICGRVCPQEEQCERVCILGIKGQPVNIGKLEAFAADYERKVGKVSVPMVAPSTGKRVAVIGSGPAGLTAASDLARMGHEVTIFEALHRPGGVLVYGIPEFRLPNVIIEQELSILEKMGVKVVVNAVIGKLDTVDELLQNGFHAVFIGAGAGLPYFMDIPGENLKGVYSANEFLTRVNLMGAYRFPEYITPVKVGKRVAVVGGGNTAMDAARTAIRLRPDEVRIVYRRSRAEAPARKEEIEHAEQEGVIFQFLTTPLRYMGDEEGWVKAMETQRMELGEPDASGRRRPVPLAGSEEIVRVDTVVVAIGFGVNPLILSTTPDLAINHRGLVVVDKETCMTSKEGVFAGGDIITGGSTVIEAMGQGKLAARSIDRYLRSEVGWVKKENRR
ncbi:MAG TPA: NADPH-dependent glutamate synthase [Dehalococcoidia bacterium]|nr:NADPH-dependent glutamate synthase [Dehalococcoidia bacterium]